MSKQRIVSGTRPTGRLHWGHYFGVIKNWIDLQSKYECFYFIADLHALTSEYENTSIIPDSGLKISTELISLGLNPDEVTLFVQSQVPAHSELFILLSMITPKSWLERVPSYKDMQLQLQNKDLNTYGFLGYPLLQAADIMLYNAHKVPVGEDQVPHVEFTREVARRFNFLCKKDVLREPHPLLTTSPRIPGLDGRKMSKSFGNAVYISDSPEIISKKLSQAITDPARMKRTDPGHPEVCNIFAYHKLYLKESEVKEISEDCKSAKIGCVDCKKKCIQTAIEFWKPVHDKLEELEKNEKYIKEVLAKGAKRANEEAEVVLSLSKRAMNVGEIL